MGFNKPTSSGLLHAKPDVIVPLNARADVAEELFGLSLPAISPVGDDESAIWDDGLLVCGVFVKQVTPQNLSAVTREVYQHILSTLGSRSLYRAWNFVPSINAENAEGDEHYRLFCAGRAEAFETHFGDAARTGMSSASAVGAANSQLTVLFCGGRDAVVHYENPRQTPAYQYPQRYGPKSPSFARATVVNHPVGQTCFISGTASILASETQFAGELIPQLQLTVENLKMIGQRAAFDLSETDPASQRFFRVYLRRWEDRAVTEQFLWQRLFQLRDVITYMQADICRAELEVEVEVTLVRH